jgi:hypothetical protein
MAGVAEDRSDTVIIDRESMFNVIDGPNDERWSGESNSVK